MLTIKQAPTTVKKLNHTMRRFEQTESTYEMNLKNGKWQHGLRNQGEIDKVEEFYGYKFTDKSEEAMEFWSGLTFNLKHFIEPIESLDNPEDLLKVRVLQEAKVISSSLEDSVTGESNSDFILYDEDAEVKMTATLYQKQDEAFNKLFILKETPKHCMAIASYLLPSNTKIKDKDTAYVRLPEYIDGKIIKGKNAAVSNFVNAVNMDKPLLYVTVDFNQGIRQNIIRKNSNNKYFNVMSGTEYGLNSDESIAFLMNPANQDELGTGAKTDKPYSLRYQLKNN